MKRILIFLSLSVGLFAAQVTMGQNIEGSPHDFSNGEAWNTTGEICVVCHTPHFAMDVEPLWNHELSAVTDYTPYSSNTLTATVDQPDGESKLCLGCHDGTVALANFGGATGGGVYVADSVKLTTDLSDDHPISFTYDDGLASSDGGLYAPGSTPAVAALLFGGKVQCSSCHNPHDNTNGYFLVMDNDGSALCLTCHNK